MKQIAAVLAAIALVACGTPKKAQRPITVSDSDYGRLQAGQTQIVEAARADLGRARDELARAKTRLTEAQQEDDLARADKTAADAVNARAAAMQKAANESRNPAQLEQARQLAEEGQLRTRTAEARMGFAMKLLASRQADVQAAEGRVAFEEARVEQAKLQALQAANVPAATKYDMSALGDRVNRAKGDLDGAEGRAREAATQALQAQRTWQELDRQLQAKGGPAAPRG